jgi:orotidine-5'-phosphate decarboxylase
MNASLCVALDAPDPGECLAVAEATRAHAGVFKVGLAAFAAGGPGLVRAVGGHRPVFLDLKLHDIPAQVAGAARSAASLGVAYLTVHASGGAEMMRAAVEAAGERVVVLAVTVLTSLDDAALAAVGMGSSVADRVAQLAAVSLDAGAGGLVCSPLELRALRTRFGPRAGGGPVLVTPGIRAEGSPGSDQRRTATLREALSWGADVVVVGRPVTEAPDPEAAARRLLQAR